MTVRRISMRGLLALIAATAFAITLGLPAPASSAELYYVSCKITKTYGKCAAGRATRVKTTGDSKEGAIKKTNKRGEKGGWHSCNEASKKKSDIAYCDPQTGQDAY
jgi:cytochrome c-type biogenesis protein CcmE